MPKVDIRLTGALADDARGQLLTRALDKATAPMTDTALIADLRSLEATVPHTDADAGWLQFALTQLHTARFQTTGSLDDAELALTAARSLPDFHNIPASVSSYERGRTAYQVGRRLGDQALLEEALHFYTVAGEHLRLRDRLRWILVRHRREVRSIQKESALLKGAIIVRPGTGELAVAGAGAFIDFAIEPFPAVDSLRWPSWPQARIKRGAQPLYCSPLGLPGEVRLHRGRKPALPS